MIDDMVPVEQTIPPKPCVCGVFCAECWVPVGDDEIAACWVCAHDYIEHEREIGLTSGLPCDCSPESIYPASVIERRALAAAAG